MINPFENIGFGIGSSVDPERAELYDITARDRFLVISNAMAIIAGATKEVSGEKESRSSHAAALFGRAELVGVGPVEPPLFSADSAGTPGITENMILQVADEMQAERAAAKDTSDTDNGLSAEVIDLASRRPQAQKPAKVTNENSEAVAAGSEGISIAAARELADAHSVPAQLFAVGAPGKPTAVQDPKVKPLVVVATNQALTGEAA